MKVRVGDGSKFYISNKKKKVSFISILSDTEFNDLRVIMYCVTGFAISITFML